jgi:hypothetical protein
MIRPKWNSRYGFGYLELFLFLAVFALILQLFPSLWFSTLWWVDIRNWPRAVWFFATWMLLLMLLAIRCGPDLYDDWRQRRIRVANKQEKKQKQALLKHERETLARRIEAMKRRVV